MRVIRGLFIVSFSAPALLELPELPASEGVLRGSPQPPAHLRWPADSQRARQGGGPEPWLPICSHEPGSSACTFWPQVRRLVFNY